ncbi:hypothetical protein G6F57_014368 [Rhizopus arrhizus]|nr:hypothetical protein G6F57_014368 [Rhizopus arrhizus]
MHVADEDLHWHRQRRERYRRDQHAPAGFHVRALAQVPRADATDHETGGDERTQRHVRQAVRERGVEHHLPPVHRVHDAIDHLVAGRRVQPAVGRQDPERGEQRAQRHHAGGQEMQARRHPAPAEHHHAEEAGFQEEGGQHFIGQQRADDRAGHFAQPRPVGTELEGHDDAADHAHAE